MISSKVLILIAPLVSFIVTFILIPEWIKRAKKAGLVGRDINKQQKIYVSEAGGITVVSGFLFGILVYVLIRVFVFKVDETHASIFMILVSILIAAIIGLVDDILGWKIGLRIRYKIAATFIIAFPMVVMNAGTSTMTFPFIGELNLSIFYPLIIVPIGIIGASNGFNMIAGYNGLETGMGIVILATLAYISYFTKQSWITVIILIMLASLLAFYFFNRYPAKIFPGNTLTYCVGSFIAIVAILANIEKYALILFTLYYLEFILKARGKMKKESYAKVTDEDLVKPYKKYYGLEHIAIDVIRKVNKRANEKNVVYLLFFMQILVGIITIICFNNNI